MEKVMSKPVKNNLLIAYFICFFLVFKSSTLLSSPIVLKGESLGMPFLVERVTLQSDTPWGMAYLPSDQIIFTLQEGGIRLLNPKTGKTTPIDGPFLNIKHGGQGGMLDVAVPHDHQFRDWIYFTFSKNVNGKGATTLARARLDSNQMVDWQELLVTNSQTHHTRHYGSRIDFDRSGHLFITIGDRGVRPSAQNLTNHAGTILRLNRDGTIPHDNPFVGRDDALSEIYTYGHRNPQGIVFDHLTGRLWAIEHGPRGGDEINLILPGNNYGWPIISYGKEYWGPLQVGEGTHKKGMKQPAKQYTPSIAPASLMLYTGNAFIKWQGSLFAGALVMTHLNRVGVDSDGNLISEERLLLALEKRIRDLVQSPEGWIYFSTDDGGIYRIRPR